MAPRPSFYYNARSAVETEFGFGWTGTFRRKVTEESGTTATVTSGTGGVVRYIAKDANGKYKSPGGLRNALVGGSVCRWVSAMIEIACSHLPRF